MPSSMPRTKARWPRMACLALSSVKKVMRPTMPVVIVTNSFAFWNSVPCLRAKVKAFRPMK